MANVVEAENDAIARILVDRRLLPLADHHQSRLDAAREHWEKLSPEAREKEIQLLLAIAESSGSGGP